MKGKIIYLNEKSEKQRDWLDTPKLLFEQGEPSFLRASVHKKAAMPLGGIGIGGMMLHSSGRLKRWRIFGNIPAAETLPGTFFAIRTQTGQSVISRVFQTEAVGELQPVNEIEFVGEFPVGKLHYIDDELPVQVKLSAFSPFIPLDARTSATPCVIFRFQLKNPSEKNKVNVSLLGSLQNAVGYDGHSSIDGVSYKQYGGNVNELWHQEDLTAILMRQDHARCEREEIVFDDFESGSYEKWKIQGNAFGDSPTPAGDIYHSQSLEEWQGDFLVDSFLESSDEARGKLTSTTFKIKRRYISFLIGGGSHSGKTCINLVVDGEVVRSETGDNSETLTRKFFDTRKLEGKTGLLEVVDDHSGSWGHILVDDIRFTDSPFSELGFNPYDGTMCIATDEEDATAVNWQSPDELYKHMRKDELDTKLDTASSSAGLTFNGALLRKIELPPQGSATVTFYLCWHFPNRLSEKRRGQERIGHRYNAWFSDAREVCEFVHQNVESISTKVMNFHHALYNGTLPHWLLELVGSQLAVLVSPTAVWMENGDFGLWEGVDSGGRRGRYEPKTGCCGINCMHVLNYEMAVAMLFPSLQRIIRRLDVDYHRRDNGSFTEKMRAGFPPYHSNPKLDNIDNTVGFPLKVYRDYLWTGDKTFLELMWPRVKAASKWLISRDLDGETIPNMRRERDSTKTFETTYDSWTMYGTSSFIGSYWLAALLACEKMALIMGEEKLSLHYRELFELAQESFERELWNGEYYDFFCDPEYDDKRLGDYHHCCISDQVIGQWWAHITGLGYILSSERIRQALSTVMQQNWFSDYEYESDVFGPKLSIYTYPRGNRQTYRDLEKSEETLTHGEFDYEGRVCYRNWTGAEMEITAHMIFEGMFEKALMIARGTYDRYDGVRANPWYHIECGGFYSRGLSCWSILLAASGFHCNVAAGFFELAPKFTPEKFRCWFGCGTGWGTFEQKRSVREQVNRLNISSLYANLS